MHRVPGWFERGDPVVQTRPREGDGPLCVGRIGLVERCECRSEKGDRYLVRLTGGSLVRLETGQLRSASDQEASHLHGAPMAGGVRYRGLEV